MNKKELEKKLELLRFSHGVTNLDTINNILEFLNTYDYLNDKGKDLYNSFYKENYV